MCVGCEECLQSTVLSLNANCCNNKFSMGFGVMLPWELLSVHCKCLQKILTGVLMTFAQEHGHEFNSDHALQELYDYIRRYQDQVNMHDAKLLYALVTDKEI